MGAADILLGHCLFWSASVGWLDTGDEPLVRYMRRISGRDAFRRAFPHFGKLAMRLQQPQPEAKI